MAGNSHFGESNNHQRSRSGGGGTSSSSSSRKGGRKSNSDKPKQPQRGLGVAQLEKIRLHGELGGGGTGSSSSHHLPSPPLPLQNPYVPNLSQEDIMRMQTVYSSSSSSFSYSTQPSSPIYGFPNNPGNIVMGMSDIERANNTGFAHSQLDPNRWSPSNAFFDTQQLHQPSMTRQLFDLQVEDSIKRRNESEPSSGNEEVDLELRLSFKSP